MDDIIPHPSWMRDIPDDAALMTLSIPGTHNSASVDGPLGFAKTQDRGLFDQLAAGYDCSTSGLRTTRTTFACTMTWYAWRKAMRKY